MRLAAVLLVLATPAADSDELSIKMESAIAGVIVYDNSGEQLSRQGSFPVHSEYVDCTVLVEVTAGPERIFPTCPSPWKVEPERLEIDDGSSGVFVLEFQGF